jgi:hypothetical protein
VTVTTLGRLPVYELCLTRLALKWKDNTLCSLVPDELSVFCINFLRERPTKISRTPPEIKKGNTVSYFWLIFFALKCDRSQFDLIPLFIADLDFESLVANFDTILRTLAIFRATRAFDRVGQFTRTLIQKALVVACRQSAFILDKLRYFIIRTFVALFFRLKVTSRSARLLRHFADSPFPQGARTSLHVNFDFNPGILVVVFGSYLTEVRYLFATSSHLDDEIRVPLLKLIERPEFASDKTLKSCRRYLLRQQPRSRTSSFLSRF